MKPILIAALLCACGSEPAAAPDVLSEPAAESSALQGGVRDSRDPAVGYVSIAGGALCTGVLVAPDVVLTAGHCVEERVTMFHTGDARRGFIGRRVVGQIAHPGYRSSGRCPNPTYDLGLLRLGAPVEGIVPLSIAPGPPRVGARCRAVGFGRHTDARGVTTVGDKRAATEEVTDVGRSWARVAWGTGIVDHGDSGGPLLCDGRVAAITSCADDPSPDRDTAYYARVDSARAWIAGAAGP